MCYDHAGQFMFQKERFKAKQTTIDAVPGDKMTLSNGLKYYVKTRPSDRTQHAQTLFKSNGMQQTDLFCFLDSAILDE